MHPALLGHSTGAVATICCSVTVAERDMGSLRVWRRECCRFEVPKSVAASTFGNFKSKSGTRIINLLVPLSLPKFVPSRLQWATNFASGGTSAAIPKFASVRVTLVCELRNLSSTGKILVLVRLWI